MPFPFKSAFGRIKPKKSPNVDRKEELQVSPTVGPCKATKLPPEMWLQIADYLPLTSQGHLGISCKHFKTMLNGRLEQLRLHGNTAERTEFLRLMQFAFPKMFWCPACLKYHYRGSLGESFYSGNGCQLQSCRISFGDPNKIDLDWLTLHMIMRYYALSEQHGERLSHLDSDKTILLNGHKVRINTQGLKTKDRRLLAKVETTAPFDTNATAGYGRREFTPFTTFVAC